MVLHGGRRDRVQVLHDALQVLHLVIKLLCAVGRLEWKENVYSKC